MEQTTGAYRLGVLDSGRTAQDAEYLVGQAYIERDWYARGRQLPTTASLSNFVFASKSAAKLLASVISPEPISSSNI